MKKIFLSLMLLMSVSQIHGFGDFGAKPSTYIVSAILSPIIYVSFIFIGITLFFSLKTALNASPYWLAILIGQIALWVTHACIFINHPEAADIAYMIVAALAPIIAYLILLKGRLIPTDWHVADYLRVIVLGSFLPGLLYMFIPLLFVFP